MDIQTQDGILLRGIPDGTPDDVIKARIAKIRGGGAPVEQAPQESAAMQRGRSMNSSAQGGINALQGPTMGFLDEIAGLGSAGVGALANLTPWGDKKSFKENYESARDQVRGATDQFREERPVTAGVTSLMASAPMMGAPGAPASQAVAMTNAARLAQALKVGTGYGAVSGVGESTAEDLPGVAEDALTGAARGAAAGGVGQTAGAVLGAAGRNVAQRVNQSSAVERARLLLADALAKDAKTPTVAQNPPARVAARNATLGAEATIADSAGQNTRQTLDTLATLPGRAKNDVEALIHSRQAGRSGRLVNAADETLGTKGAGYSESLNALEAMQKSAQAPHREALQGVIVKADKELVNLLERVPDAHKAAELLATREGVPQFDMSKIKVGDRLPFESLDTLKKALWTIAEKEKVNFAATAESRATNGVRVELTDKLDRLSPKDAQGNSIYKLARDAFAGPAQLRGAVEAGRTAIKADTIAVTDMVDGMSKGELQAFRVGALQGLRDQLGREAGQTSLLKMWKEPATSGKLREIFGDNYRDFAVAVAKERELKLLESTGRGSQTAARLLGAGELDAAGAASSIAGVAANAAGGHPVGTIASAASAASRAWNQVRTPQAVRDELAKLLLLKGPDAQRELATLPDFIKRANTAATRRAAATGFAAQQLSRDK